MADADAVSSQLAHAMANPSCRRANRYDSAASLRIVWTDIRHIDIGYTRIRATLIVVGIGRSLPLHGRDKVPQIFWLCGAP